jgi:hypothetical protein
MTTLPTQAEILFGDNKSTDPDFYFATKLISQLQRELHQNRRRLLMAASRWLVAYEYIKDLEERLMLQENPLEKERRFFLGTVTVLCGLGRLLAARLQEADEIKVESLGLSYDDLSACIDELADIDRAAHREWTPEMKEAIETQVFGARHQ